MELTEDRLAPAERLAEAIGKLLGAIAALFFRAALVFWLYGIVGPLFSLPVLTYLQTVALVWMVRLVVLPKPSRKKEVGA